MNGCLHVLSSRWQQTCGRDRDGRFALGRAQTHTPLFSLAFRFFSLVLCRFDQDRLVTLVERVQTVAKNLDQSRANDRLFLIVFCSVDRLLASRICQPCGWSKVHFVCAGVHVLVHLPMLPCSAFSRHKEHCLHTSLKSATCSCRVSTSPCAL